MHSHGSPSGMQHAADSSPRERRAFARPDSRRILDSIATLAERQDIGTDELTFIESTISSVPSQVDDSDKDARGWKRSKYAVFANTTLLVPVLASRFLPDVTGQLCSRIPSERDSDGAIGVLEPLSRFAELRLWAEGDRAIITLESACAEAVNAKPARSPYAEIGKVARGRLFQLWGLLLGQYPADFTPAAADRMYKTCMYAIRSEWPRWSSAEGPKSWAALDGMIRGLNSLLQSYPTVVSAVSQERTLTPDKHIPAQELASIAVAALSLLGTLRTRVSSSLFVACVELVSLHACGACREALLPQLIRHWDIVLSTCESTHKKVAKAAPAALIALTQLCATHLQARPYEPSSSDTGLYKELVHARLLPMLRGEVPAGALKPDATDATKSAATADLRLRLALRCLPCIAFVIVRFEGEPVALCTTRDILQQATILANSIPDGIVESDSEAEIDVPEDEADDAAVQQQSSAGHAVPSTSPLERQDDAEGVQQAPRKLAASTLGNLLASALSASAAFLSSAPTSLAACPDLLPLLHTCLLDLLRLWPYLDEKPRGQRALAARAVAVVLVSIHAVSRSTSTPATLQMFISNFTRALWRATLERLPVSNTTSTHRWLHPVTGEPDNRAIWVFTPLWIQLCNFDGPEIRQATAEMLCPPLGGSCVANESQRVGVAANSAGCEADPDRLASIERVVCSELLSLLTEHMQAWDLSLLAVGEVAVDIANSGSTSTLTDSAATQSVVTGQTAALTLRLYDNDTTTSSLQPADPVAYDQLLSAADFVRYALPHFPTATTKLWTAQVLGLCTQLASTFPHVHSVWSIGATFLLIAQVDKDTDVSTTVSFTGSHSSQSSSGGPEATQHAVGIAAAEERFFQSASHQLQQARGSALLSVLQALVCMPSSYVEQFPSVYMEAAGAAIRAGLDEPILAIQALKLLDTLPTAHMKSSQLGLRRMWTDLLLLMRSSSAQASSTAAAEVTEALGVGDDSDEQEEEEELDLQQSIHASRGIRKQAEAMTSLLTDDTLTILSPAIQVAWRTYGVDLTQVRVRGGLIDRLQDLQPGKGSRYSSAIVKMTTGWPSTSSTGTLNLFEDPRTVAERNRLLACLSTLHSSEATVAPQDVVVAAASLLGRLGSIVDGMLQDSTSSLSEHMGREGTAGRAADGLSATLRLPASVNGASLLNITLALDKYAHMLCDIACSSPSPPARLAAGEALHAIVSAATGQACFTGKDTHWDLLATCLGPLLRLASQEKDASRALFGSLVDQLMVLYGSDPWVGMDTGSRGEPAASEIASKRRTNMLDVLFDHMLGGDAIVAGRAARALGSYVLACLRSLTSGQTEEQWNTMPTGAGGGAPSGLISTSAGAMHIRVRPAMNRLCAAARHPSTSARLSACMAWAVIYKEYRENSSLVSATLLELVDAFMTCLRLSSRDDLSAGTEAAASSAFDHLLRILQHPTHAAVLKRDDSSRSKGSPCSLRQLAAWMYLRCSVPETTARRKAMLLFGETCELIQRPNTQHRRHAATSGVMTASVQEWITDLCNGSGEATLGMLELSQPQRLEQSSSKRIASAHAGGARDEGDDADDPSAGEEVQMEALQSHSALLTLPGVIPGHGIECLHVLITFPVRSFPAATSSLDSANLPSYTRALSVALDVATWVATRKLVALQELFLAGHSSKRKRTREHAGYTEPLTSHLLVALEGLFLAPVSEGQQRRDRRLLFCRLLVFCQVAATVLPHDLDRRLRTLVCTALVRPALLSLDHDGCTWSSSQGSDAFLKGAIAAAMKTHDMAVDCQRRMEDENMDLSALAGYVSAGRCAAVNCLYRVASVLSDAGLLQIVLEHSKPGYSLQWACDAAMAVSSCLSPPADMQAVLPCLLSLVLPMVPVSGGGPQHQAGNHEPRDLFHILGIQEPSKGTTLLQKYQHITVTHLIRSLKAGQGAAASVVEQADQTQHFFTQLKELLMDVHRSEQAMQLLAVLCDAVVVLSSPVDAQQSALRLPASPQVVTGLLSIVEHWELLPSDTRRACMSTVMRCLLAIDPWLAVCSHSTEQPALTSSLPVRALSHGAEQAVSRWLAGQPADTAEGKGLSDESKAVIPFLPYFLPGFSRMSRIPAEAVAPACLRLPELTSRSTGRGKQLNHCHRAALQTISTLVSQFPSSSRDVSGSMDSRVYFDRLTALCQCLVSSGSVHVWRRLAPSLREGKQHGFYSLVAGALQALASTVPLEGPSFHAWAIEVLLTCFADGTDDYSAGKGADGYFAPLLECASLIPVLVDNFLVPLITSAPEQALQLLLTEESFFRQLASAAASLPGGARMCDPGHSSTTLGFLLTIAGSSIEQTVLSTASAPLLLSRRAASFSILAALFHQYRLRSIATGTVELRRDKLKREYGRQARASGAAGDSLDADKLLFRDLQDACSILLASRPALTSTPMVSNTDLTSLHQVAYVALAAGTQLTQNKVAAHSSVLFSHTGKYAIDWSRIWPHYTNENAGGVYLPRVDERVEHVAYDLSRLVTAPISFKVSRAASRFLNFAQRTNAGPDAIQPMASRVFGRPSTLLSVASMASMASLQGARDLPEHTGAIGAAQTNAKITAEGPSSFSAASSSLSVWVDQADLASIGHHHTSTADTGIHSDPIVSSTQQATATLWIPDLIAGSPPFLALLREIDIIVGMDVEMDATTGMPKWMAQLYLWASQHTESSWSLHQRLVATNLALNRPLIFQPYASQWAPILLSTVLVCYDTASRQDGHPKPIIRYYGKYHKHTHTLLMQKVVYLIGTQWLQPNGSVYVPASDSEKQLCRRFLELLVLSSITTRATQLEEFKGAIGTLIRPWERASVRVARSNIMKLLATAMPTDTGHQSRETRFAAARIQLAGAYLAYCHAVDVPCYDDASSIPSERSQLFSLRDVLERIARFLPNASRAAAYKVYSVVLGMGLAQGRRTNEDIQLLKEVVSPSLDKLHNSVPSSSDAGSNERGNLRYLVCLGGVAYYYPGIVRAHELAICRTIMLQTKGRSYLRGDELSALVGILAGCLRGAGHDGASTESGARHRAMEVWGVIEGEEALTDLLSTRASSRVRGATVQQQALELIADLIALDAIPMASLADLFDSSKPFGLPRVFSSHSHAGTRLAYHAVCRAVIGRGHASLDSVSATVHAARLSLFLALTDEEDVVRMRAYRFWDEGDYMPVGDVARRLHVLLANCTTETTSSWLLCAAPLLLASARSSTDFNDKKAINREAITDTLVPAPLLDDGASRSTRSLKPRFAHMIAQSLIQGTVTALGRRGGKQLATQWAGSLFSQTVKSAGETPNDRQLSSMLSFQPVPSNVAVRAGDGARGIAVPQKPSALGMAKVYSMLARGTMSDAQERIASLRASQSDAMINAGAPAPPTWRYDLPSSLMGVPLGRAPASAKQIVPKVSTIRSYRIGVLPDVQMSMADIFGPIQALCQYDSAVANQVFADITRGVLEAMSNEVVSKQTVGGERVKGTIKRTETYALAPRISKPSHAEYRHDDEVSPAPAHTTLHGITAALQNIAHRLATSSDTSVNLSTAAASLVETVQTLLFHSSYLSAQKKAAGPAIAAGADDSTEATALPTSFSLHPNLLGQHATLHRSYASSILCLHEGLVRSSQYPGNATAPVFAPYTSGMPTVPSGAGSADAPLPSNTSGASLAVICREMAAQQVYGVDRDAIAQAWSNLQDLYASLGDEDAMLGVASIREDMATLAAMNQASHSASTGSGTPVAMDEDVAVSVSHSSRAQGLELELLGRVPDALQLYASLPEEVDIVWDRLRCLAALEHWPQAYGLIDQLCPFDAFPAWLASNPPSARLELVGRTCFHMYLSGLQDSLIASRLVTKQGMLPPEDSSFNNLDVSRAREAAAGRLQLLRTSYDDGLWAACTSMLESVGQSSRGMSAYIAKACAACSRAQLSAASQVARLSPLAITVRSSAMRSLVPLADLADWLHIASPAAVIRQTAAGTQAAGRARASLLTRLVPTLDSILHRRLASGCLPPVQASLHWDKLLCSRAAIAIHAESLLAGVSGSHGIQHWTQSISRRLHVAAVPSLLEAGGVEMSRGWARRLLRMPQDRGLELAPENARLAEVSVGKLYLESSTQGYADRCLALRSATLRMSMAAKSGPDSLERHLKGVYTDISDILVQVQSRRDAVPVSAFTARHALASHVGFGRQVSLGEAFLARATHALLHQCQVAKHGQCTYVKGEGHAYGPSQNQAMQQLSACVDGRLRQGGPGYTLAFEGSEVDMEEDTDVESPTVADKMRVAGVPPALLRTHLTQVTRSRLLLASYADTLLRLEEAGHAEVTQPALNDLASMANATDHNSSGSMPAPGTVAAWLTKLVLQAAAEPVAIHAPSTTTALPAHILKLFASFDDFEARQHQETFIRPPSVLLPRVIELCTQYPAAHQQLAAVVQGGRSAGSKGPPLYAWLPCIQQMFASLLVQARSGAVLGSSGSTLAQLLSALAHAFPQALYYQHRMAWATARPRAVQQVWDIKTDTKRPDMSMVGSLTRIAAALGPVAPLLDSWADGLQQLQPVKMLCMEWLENVAAAVKCANALKMSTVPKHCSKWLLEQLTAHFADVTGHVRMDIGTSARHFWEKYGSRLVTACSNVEGAVFSDAVLKDLYRTLGDAGMTEFTGFKELMEASTWLATFRGYDQPPGLVIEVPGQYDAHDGMAAPQVELHSQLSYLHPTLTVMPSMRRPVRFTAVSNDERVQSFLAKAGEDLRTDARVESVLRTASKLWAESHIGKRKGLSCRTYAVIPISPMAGLVQWVPNTTTFKAVIENEARARFAAREQSLARSSNPADRTAAASLRPLHERDSKSRWQTASSEATQIRHVWLKAWYKLTEEGARGEPLDRQFGPAYGCLYRTEAREGEQIWLDLMKYQPTDLLRAALQGMATSPDAVLLLRAHIMRSLTSFTAASYLISLGDRHLDNFLLDLRTGEMVSIDFGAAFGAGTTTLPVPELMPVRCTPSILTLAAPLPTPLLLLSMTTSAWSILQEDASHTGSGRLMQQLQLFVTDPTVDWQQAADKRSQLGRSSSEPAPVEEGDRATALRDAVGSPRARAKLLQAELRLRGANPSDMLFLDLLQNNHYKGPLCKGRGRLKEAHVLIPSATAAFPSTLAGMRAAVYASHRQAQQQPRTRDLNNRPIAMTAVEKSLLQTALGGPMTGNAEPALNVGVGGQAIGQCQDSKQQVACMMDLASDPNILARQWTGLATWF